MDLPNSSDSKILRLTLTLSNYPILAEKIRQQMRHELFVKGIVPVDVFEEEVEKKAVASQWAEGLTDPINEEPEEIWQERLARVRDYLTDFYFAYNLPYRRFEEIVQAVVSANRPDQPQTVTPFFNPELAPWYLLFEQAEKYATAPPEIYENVKHHLREIVVVLLKGLVSDQLEFIRIAREFIDIYDLKQIKGCKIGRGKIGGKAAGMILAYKILQHPEPEDKVDLTGHVCIPETFFVGSDIYYAFKAVNNLEYTVSVKYRSREQIERDYPKFREAYRDGQFPDYVVEQIREVMGQLGDCPLIVRSSSLLEDSFGSAFAGKYDSYFLPNQGTPEENLSALLKAIAKIYASVLNPAALFYRQIHRLEDYDERMAILIQKVEGERHGKYFFPIMAGVGFSRNPYIWNKKLRPEEGFLRLVFGLGTRAVDRVDRDYPRMIGLSHPLLRPVTGAADVRKYSQNSVDVINLEANTLETVPVTEVLSSDFPGVQYLASVDEGDFIKPIFSLGSAIPPETMILTFENLLKNTDFAQIMRTMLAKLERHYRRPVDIEFTVQVVPGYPKPNIIIHLLQCRPLSNQQWTPNVVIPTDIPLSDQLFTVHHIVPQGIVEKIKYIVYVDPVAYSKITNRTTRLELARVIGRLNKQLEEETFVLMGPGRWGSSNIALGVKVTYADIYNTSMLIEVAIANGGATPEVSYGTHFFQDLVESNIYPLSVYPNDPNVVFHWEFFEKAPNHLSALLPKDSHYADYIRVIDIPETSQGKFLRVLMNAEENRALGYLRAY
jgi:hypothetical protein